MDANFILDVLLKMTALILSLSLHEFGHAYAAYRLGDPTASMLGRMTLDPRAHVDPIGTLLIPVVRFLVPGLLLIGWAKPVPVNAGNFSHPRRDSIIVSVAGPAANLFLALVALSSIFFFDANGYLGMGEVLRGEVESFFRFFFWMNFGLAVFNMIPIPPLDGHWVLKELLPPKMSYAYSSLSSYGYIILIAGLYFGLFEVFFRPAEMGLYVALNGAGLGRIAEILWEMG